MADVPEGELARVATSASDSIRNHGGDGVVVGGFAVRHLLGKRETNDVDMDSSVYPAPSKQRRVTKPSRRGIVKVTLKNSRGSCDVSLKSRRHMSLLKRHSIFDEHTRTSFAKPTALLALKICTFAERGLCNVVKGRKDIHDIMRCLESLNKNKDLDELPPELRTLYSKSNWNKVRYRLMNQGDRGNKCLKIAERLRVHDVL